MKGENEMSNYGRFFAKPVICAVLTIIYMRWIGVDVAVSMGTLSFFALLSLGIEYFVYKRNERRCKNAGRKRTCCESKNERWDNAETRRHGSPDCQRIYIRRKVSGNVR